MAYSPDTLKRIVELGGNLELLQSYSPQILEEVILIAKSTDANVTIGG